MIWFFIVAAVLFGVGIGTIRVGLWHGHEAAYWYDVADRVRRNPELEDVYRPILEHAKANKPSPLRRAIGWRSPPARMGRP